MDEATVRQRMLAQFGLRIEPEMTRYVIERLKAGAAEPEQLPVMGGDARTGAPVRRFIPPAALRDLPPPAST